MGSETYPLTLEIALQVTSLSRSVEQHLQFILHSQNNIFTTLKLTIAVRPKVSYKFYVFICWKFLWVQTSSQKMTIKLQFIVSWIVKRRRRNILFKLNTMNSAFQPQACNWKQSQSPVHQGTLNGRVSTSTRVPGMDLGCSGLCTGLHTANLHGFVLLHCLHHRSYADITLEYWSRELDPSVTAFFFLPCLGFSWLTAVLQLMLENYA